MMRGPSNLLIIQQIINRIWFLLLTDEHAEQRPDMNIKVTAFTVSEKSNNMSQVTILILKAPREISRSTFSVVFRFCHLYSRMDWPNWANNILRVDVICTIELFIKVYPFVLYIMYVYNNSTIIFVNSFDRTVLQMFFEL